MLGHRSAILLLSTAVFTTPSVADEPWVGTQLAAKARTTPVAEMFRLARPVEDLVSFELDPEHAAALEATWAEGGDATAKAAGVRGRDVDSPIVVRTASAPTSNLDRSDLAVELFDLEEAPLREVPTQWPWESDTAPADKAVGKGKAHFSSSRLVPLDADRAYPYRAVGKIVSDLGDGSFASCSGALISPRLVLTAGHCVHSGTANPGFAAAFVFAPGYRAGEAPFGVWEATAVWTTQAWANGKGKVPNAGDFAVIELSDRVVGGQLVSPGHVVGWLGFVTQRLKPNHIHSLGYPGNHDDGEIMHLTTAAHARGYGLKNEGYGSDMMQGSSGGPWVQNFGAAAVGQPTPVSNQIVGVTSWGTTKPADFFIAVSSTPDGKTAQMINQACANQAGNC